MNIGSTSAGDVGVETAEQLAEEIRLAKQRFGVAADGAYARSTPFAGYDGRSPAGRRASRRAVGATPPIGEPFT